jgi:two-component system, NarL family, nitrate/nitrite response regulator NarL
MGPTHDHLPGAAGRLGRPSGAQGMRTVFASRVGIASDQALLAETIGAALSSHGIRILLLSWKQEPDSDDLVGPGGPEHRPADPDLGVVLLICDLGTPARVDEVRERGRRCLAPWVVMADQDRGPAWGALLDAGARAVVHSSISLDALVDTLDTVLRGESPLGVAERIALLREWRVAQQHRDLLRDRMRTLSPREQTVLTMLYEGTTVRAIADRLDVSEATVRSQVKAVLRKLAVASQLAAVAAVGELQEEDRTYD